ncbi:MULTISPECIES: hypothetical protein [unclassified Massilia]|uniref:hypothetical protein n=1 Tax=unclassified Massilia TaxID=2609279 RepID=UPI001E5E0391|nr:MULTISPECIES: hypothetical protein [unclassified Massilia]
MFSIVLNIVGTLMHFYVAHRLQRIAFVRANVAPGSWWLAALAVWLVYLAGIHRARAPSTGVGCRGSSR